MESHVKGLYAVKVGVRMTSQRRPHSRQNYTKEASHVLVTVAAHRCEGSNNDHKMTTWLAGQVIIIVGYVVNYCGYCSREY